MKARWWGACGLAAAAIACSAAPALAAEGDLNAYRVEATPQNLRALAEAGYDVTEGRNSKRGTVDVVATANQISQLKVDARKVVDAAGRSVGRPLAAEDPGHQRRAPRTTPPPARRTRTTPSGASTTRSTSPTTRTTRRTSTSSTRSSTTGCSTSIPTSSPKRVVGQTYGGRDIVALQVTKDPTGADVAGQPAVLYNAMQHAREWLAGETCKRTLSYFVDNYGKTTSAGLEVTQLVDNNELWFVCVNNPDGYEYTFTDGNRLWRKNLRDNDNNGAIELGDGVDPNRNFSANWGRDDEGSSPDPTTETYRGPSPASEPETQAMEELFAEIHPVFQKNDHTAAELLLYPQGFQQDTPTADHEIFTALAGDPFKPGIEGFLPELWRGPLHHQRRLHRLGLLDPEARCPTRPRAPRPRTPTSPASSTRTPSSRSSRSSGATCRSRSTSPSRPTTRPSPTRTSATRPTTSTVDSFPYVLRRPAAGPGDRQAQARRRHDEVQHQRRPDDDRPDQGVHGRRALLQERRRLLPPRPRLRLRHQARATRSRCGSRPAARTSRDFTYDAVTETTNPVLLLVRRGLVRRPAGARPQSGPAYLDTYKALLDSLGIKYDVYDVDPRTAWRRTTSAS